MRTTLWLALWRQRLTSPVRMVLLSAMFFLPLMFMVGMRGMGFTALGDSMAIALLFGAGLIGQDVSTGVLQLLLARPIRRWEYVVHRWLAAAIGAATVSTVQVVLGWGLLHLREGAPPVDAMLLFAAGRTLEVFGIIAIVTLLSTLIGGLGDLALYVLLVISFQILGAVADAASWRMLIPVVRIVNEVIHPTIEMAQFRAGAPSWYALAAYASSVALALWLAVVNMNRKELSYASSS